MGNDVLGACDESKKRRCWVRILVFSVMAVLTPFALFEACVVHTQHVYKYESTRPQTGSPFDSGNQVIAAIEQYKADKGNYPPDLLALIPKHLTQIPAPGWGDNQWIYYRYEWPECSFQLGVWKNSPFTTINGPYSFIRGSQTAVWTYGNS